MELCTSLRRASTALSSFEGRGASGVESSAARGGLVGGVVVRIWPLRSKARSWDTNRRQIGGQDHRHQSKSRRARRSLSSISFSSAASSPSRQGIFTSSISVLPPVDPTHPPLDRARDSCLAMRDLRVIFSASPRARQRSAVLENERDMCGSGISWVATSRTSGGLDPGPALAFAARNRSLVAAVSRAREGE